MEIIATSPPTIYFYPSYGTHFTSPRICHSDNLQLQKKLAEHINKLADIKKTGGYSSSVEREIRTFQSQLDAINDLLK